MTISNNANRTNRPQTQSNNRVPNRLLLVVYYEAARLTLAHLLELPTVANGACLRTIRGDLRCIAKEVRKFFEYRGITFDAQGSPRQPAVNLSSRSLPLCKQLPAFVHDEASKAIATAMHMAPCKTEEGRTRALQASTYLHNQAVKLRPCLEFAEGPDAQAFFCDAQTGEPYGQPFVDVDF